MEKYRSVLRCFLPLFLLLLLPFQNADARHENMSNPIANVNLSPFWQWRSASECLIYFQLPSPCPDKYKLTMDGYINVNQADIADYCKLGGCADHTRDVLQCIHEAKRDFWFANKASVSVLNDTISSGCRSNSSISTAGYTSSSIKHKLPAWATPFLSATVFAILLNL